jgi:hypothetical protein
MHSTARPTAPILTPVFAWPRVRFTLVASFVFGLFLSIDNPTPTGVLVVRATIVGLACLAMFGVLERRPRRLPKWIARVPLQIVGVALVIPLAAALSHVVTLGGDPELPENGRRMAGLGWLIFWSLLFAPWIAVGAILKQRSAFAHEQALAFDLERSEFARQALDARLRLLQAQVAPHFLFNTLANVQALVEAGSPQASRVLASLIAYLRAAVPRMESQLSTLDREVELARAYLDVMQMRMPDRLHYALHLDPAAARMQCPPMTLLTLVENAVRHGIDPSETGGRIDADIWLRDGRCLMRVTDTGAGLDSRSHGLGTGLANLRERLQLAFGNDVSFKLTEKEPHGVCAELGFPARAEAT